MTLKIPTLNINNYNEMEIKEGLDAEIEMLKKLIFSQEYSDPSIPIKQGLNIRKYGHKNLDENLMAEISEELKELIDIHMPNSFIYDIECTKFNTNTMVIIVKLYQGTIQLVLEKSDKAVLLKNII